MTTQASRPSVDRGMASQTGPSIGGYTVAFGLSFAITSVLSALLVILKESNQATVLAWMKAATGHHWVTHGLLDVIVFVVLGVLLAKVGGGVRMTANALSATIVGATVLSGLIIAGFFL